MAPREVSPRTRLIRLGFTDAGRAADLLQEPALQAALQRAEEAGHPLPEALGRTADPDLALLALLRLVDAVRGTGHEADLTAALAQDGEHRSRLLAVLGASSALGDMLVTHPGDLALLAPRPGETSVLDLPPQDERRHALEAVGADPAAELPVAAVGAAEGVALVRRTYRRRLLEIAAADLTCPDALTALPLVAAALADIAAAALDAALAVARADLPDHGRHVRLAVLGMGKTGGRELNYVSDVDVVYVAEPVPGTGTEEAEVVRTGTRLASALARVCSGPGTEPPLWPVDANLRPEGKDGPLVRSLASHVAYYERWAKTWEFQALLKARPVAGDVALGQEYCAAVAPLVWSAVERENFVADAQAMRRRVEAHVPPAEADRQLKLGRGGLRDVEFTVQLLQLVHGRTDPSIRSRTTLQALDQLRTAGYVARDAAAELDRCYRLLRVLEHRIQLHRLRRTHLVPSGEEDLRRLGRAIGTDGGAESLERRWQEVRRRVRNLHEEIYYRPLLPATAQLSAADVSLAPDAARARLHAIGYRNPDGAVRHIAALTEGVSRRAAIQRQLLPVMLGWFSDGPDPDAGLLAFRKLSEVMGSTHWFLKLLRDSGAAARRLAGLLSSSPYVAQALSRLPEAVAWLDDDADLAPRDPEALWAEMDALLRRREQAEAAARTVRYLRRRELTRAAVGDVLDGVRGGRDATMLTPAADVALRAALRVAVRQSSVDLDEPPSDYLVVAMGRLGGQEMTYGSDADVLFVHQPRPGADPHLADQVATAVATQVRALLGEPGAELPLPVDADLRPEGRNGPLVRTLASYAEYYDRWVEPWERQALLRARPVAGDPALAQRFCDLIDPVRYPPEGLPAAMVRDLRRIKARVESERMPRGVEPTRHLKLGRGGLSDVEWTVQLLQLQHAGRVPALRTTATLPALRAAAEAGLLDPEDCGRLAAAWTLASRIRSAIALGTGRTTGAKIDVLPAEPHTLAVVARMLGYDPDHTLDLEEDYLRAARRARRVVERAFFG